MNTKRHEKVVIVGIAGASGSGKSFFADKLKSALPDKKVLVLSQDFYYKERSDMALEDREHINYDHPGAIDFDLLIEHLKALKQKKSILHPLYDFAVHNRQKEWVPAGPADVVLLDGILIYAVEALHSILDYKIYIDTPMDICFIRRLQRDTTVRGRTVDSVINQYLKTVRPMFLEFVLPGKKIANVVIVGQGSMNTSLQYVLREIKEV